jgi:hypothetical protein
LFPAGCLIILLEAGIVPFCLLDGEVIMQPDQKQLEQYLSHIHGRPVWLTGMAMLGGERTGAAALKAFGYGRPLRLAYQIDGQSHQAVLRQVAGNGFGREMESDRVAAVWLDFHVFNELPCHVAALAHIRDDGEASKADYERVVALAVYLAHIHAVKRDDPLLWRRRLRDLVGHGEGIMGLTDSYPTDFPLATKQDWQALEAAANEWRWRLKPLSHRLSQVHGDFHPFNILFPGNGGVPVFIDRSRGAWGEPADDVSCLTINYLFFALQRYERLTGPFWDLYTAFWERYLAECKDEEMLAVIQPWYAWRALVLASPQWYPTIAEGTRRKLLAFAHRVLTEPLFKWQAINDYLEA